MQSLINKYFNQICFVRFLLDSFPLLFMSIALVLSCRELSSSAIYPCPSIKYMNHRDCGKASSAPSILASVEILPFIFCFCNNYIIDPGPVYIISPVLPLQYICTEKDISTHRWMVLILSYCSISGRCRVPLMCLSTRTRFPQSSSSGIITWLHSKATAILMSFL